MVFSILAPLGRKNGVPRDPSKNDPNFDVKLASKKEFFDTRYVEKTKEDYKNIKKIAETFCENTEFELEPHQMFVRNFLSFLTPYNSLLLYHGLGTGKTCSAISVCEEMRTYNSQMGDTRRIIIVASPKVQENFKIQLFDERKLKKLETFFYFSTCLCDNYVPQWWVEFNDELFNLFAENIQILLKISVIPIYSPYFHLSGSA